MTYVEKKACQYRRILVDNALFQLLLGDLEARRLAMNMDCRLMIRFVRYEDENKLLEE